jgi:hypothetical protein
MRLRRFSQKSREHLESIQAKAAAAAQKKNKLAEKSKKKSTANGVAEKLPSTNGAAKQMNLVDGGVVKKKKTKVAAK